MAFTIKIGLLTYQRRVLLQNVYGVGDKTTTRMADVEMNDPDVYRKNAPVDDRGRVHIGREHANKDVTIVVEVQD